MFITWNLLLNRWRADFYGLSIYTVHVCMLVSLFSSALQNTHLKIFKNCNVLSILGCVSSYAKREEWSKSFSTKVMTVKALTGVCLLTRQIIYCLKVFRNLLEEHYKSWSTLATLMFSYILGLYQWKCKINFQKVM